MISDTHASDFDKTSNADKRRLIENFFSLSLLKAINYVLPLVTVPYLVRILGPEKFGLIVFVQAFTEYLRIFTDYGFNLSSTRKISIYRNDQKKVSEIFCSTMFIKLVFMSISFFVLVSVVYAIPKFSEYLAVYVFAFGTVVGNVLFPLWFFQGLERMQYITFLNLLARAIFTGAIFLFIKEQADYIYVPLFNSLGSVIAGILSLWIVSKYFKVTFGIPSLPSITEGLKDGWHVFISNVAISLYTVSNIFILGIFANNVIVGYYGAAEKIITAIRGLLDPAAQSVYPYISKLVNESREKALRFIAKTMIVVAGGSLLISAAIFFFAGTIINVVLGGQYQESIIVLQILAFLPFIIALSNIFGIQTMLTFDMKRAFSRIIVSAGFLNIVLALFLVPVYKHIGISICVLTTETYVTTAMFLYLQYKDVKLIVLPALFRRGAR